MEIFQGMFGKIAPGMCRLSMDGSIAIKTSGGYRTYSAKTGKHDRRKITNKRQRDFFILTYPFSSGDQCL